MGSVYILLNFIDGGVLVASLTNVQSKNTLLVFVGSMIILSVIDLEITVVPFGGCLSL